MKLFEIIGRAGAVALYGWFSWVLGWDVYNNLRISSALLLVFALCVACFYFVRRDSKALSLSPYDWLIAMLGTLLPLLLRPAQAAHDLLPLQGVQFAGIAISLVGLWSLNMSFGLVAANRGVQTSGMYRYVRHPIYAGYFLSYAAYAAQNPTLPNIMLTALWIMFEIFRIFAEEDCLAQDPAYAAYMKQVRWRVLPGVF